MLQVWHPQISLSPEKVSVVYYFSGRYFKFSKWVPTYGLGDLQVSVFALGPTVSDSACYPFKSGFSMLYSSVVFLDVIFVFKV